MSLWLLENNQRITNERNELEKDIEVELAIQKLSKKKRMTKVRLELTTYGL
tara:strand:- start:1253 stop:1405 length:153 start_codon:yes stop_codon:yes gene_type:complete